MNVLIFVMTMLMLMAIITYAKLETFRDSQAYQVIFENYMQADERGAIKVAAQKNYDTPASTNSGSTGTKVPAIARVSIRLLVDAKERKAHPKETAELAALLKNLMTVLYGNQPFFQEIEKTRPTFLDEIISSIEKASDALPKDQAITRAKGLSNLNLGDPELNEVFYKMLHGAPAKEFATTPPKEENILPTLLSEKREPEIEPKETDEATRLAKLEAKEYTSSQGYYSLLDFISADKIYKIRVYLAFPPILKSIFNEDATVDEILKTRKELYRSLVNNNDEKPDTKQANSVFKGQFDSRRNPAFDETILDYNVTPTNPAKYEKGL